jgi:hypothetical protein
MDLSPDGAARSTLALTTHTCPYNGFYFRIYIYDEPSSLSLSSAESVRKQLKALTHKKRHPCVAAAAAALLPLMLFFSYLSSLHFARSPTTVFRRREEEERLQALLRKDTCVLPFLWFWRGGGQRSARRPLCNKKCRSHARTHAVFFSFSRRLHSFFVVPRSRIHRKIAFPVPKIKFVEFLG